VFTTLLPVQEAETTVRSIAAACLHCAAFSRDLKVHGSEHACQQGKTAAKHGPLSTSCASSECTALVPQHALPSHDRNLSAAKLYSLHENCLALRIVPPHPAFSTAVHHSKDAILTFASATGTASRYHVILA
jgi:hypothetical protein